MEIARQVQEFIVDNFFYGVPQTQLKKSDSFLKTGMLDSTGMLELITFLENTYHIAIQDEELIPENLDSLENVTQFVSRKIGNRN